MLDFPTLIFKYGLPGLPLSFVIAYQLIPDKENISDFATLALVIALLVGYVIQQLWFLFFEFLPISYNKKTRKVLVWLGDELKKDKNKKMRERWGIKPEEELNGDKLYSIWESILYKSNFKDNALEKLKGFWNYYHSNMAISIGLVLGALAYHYFKLNWSPLILPSFVGCSLILMTKAIQSKRIVDVLEKNWAEEFVETLVERPKPPTREQKRQTRK